MYKSFKIIGLLSFSVALAACEPASTYPLEVKNDLMSMCMEGIMTDQTPVLNEDHAKEDIAKNLELCEFRYQNFVKKIPYTQYERYQRNLYESFERAYRQKYVLSDVYNNLSDNDQKVFESIAKIMLGLGDKEE